MMLAIFSKVPLLSPFCCLPNEKLSMDTHTSCVHIKSARN